MMNMQVTKLRPKGDRYYDNVALRYERKRKKQEWWHVEQKEMESLLDLLPKGLKVVDIPFGTGRFVPFYAERGYKISGLDASDHMLNAAKEALGELYDQCDCVTGSAAKLPYKDKEFDLVVSTRFLRDIVTFGDAKKMLAEMARVSSKYAILQLGENPDGHIMPTDDDVMGSDMKRQSVDALLKKHGFKVMERRLVLQNAEVGAIHHILCKKI